MLVVDVDPVAAERLTEYGADGVAADLSDPGTVSKAVADADLVVGAVPGFMGYKTVERVLQDRHPVVDVSFFPEDAFGLDELAKEAGVPCLVDCDRRPKGEVLDLSTLHGAEVELGRRPGVGGRDRLSLAILGSGLQQLEVHI